MRVLVLGGGGREDALVWKIAQSSRVSRIFAAPGNPGTAERATNLPCDMSPGAVLKLVREQNIELLVVGPEVPLAEGVADLVQAEASHCLVFGPDREACRLEWSKGYAKEFMNRHGIPTAQARQYERLADFFAEGNAGGLPYVIKTDGLAAGKGVVVCLTDADVSDARATLPLDKPAVVEEYLRGREISLHFITDGHNYHMLELAEDHKQLYDGDAGPNTGGMGTYSPLCDLPADMSAQARRIADQTMAGLFADGITYRGVIFIGLMLTEQGLKVLEYNCRFGDPETQVIVARLDCDLVPYLTGAAAGSLPSEAPGFVPDAATCVVACGGEYPRRSSNGEAIHGVADAKALGNLVFHAGTAITDGKLV
ncbi:MAG TPA: phosphoribosylamine--glycine ligase, partial [Bacillota bacterium]|nr:phosphoribosylamine--glycine ligase [Bacillota bacterium]